MSEDDLERLRRAVRTIRTLRAEVAGLEGAAARPIAVVGMACRFPGAPDVPSFWRLLREGGSAIGDVPEGRWSAPPRDAAGRPWRARGGFLPDLDTFDAAFFHLSPREARQMDPQQRLLLEVAWHAVESSGRDPRSLDGSRTGVFAGVAESEYARLAERHGAGTASMTGVTGNACSVAGGRISYHLGLRGPNLSIDTACSSSLSAVHLAVASLRSGESDLALAGGVNALLLPETFTAFLEGGALAADGVCKVFDADADGYGRGEGCGMLVLRRLDDARADGDDILAVIRGSAVGQDGRTNGLTAPNGVAQQAVIRAALADARVEPADIAYVETHGTGTELGDPVEVDALTAVFGDRTGRLPVGAVKAAIGHLEAAAGIAGLIKTILVLRHGEIPPAAHLRRLNPHVDWAATPVTPAPELSALDGELAGVSSFGFSGTNAHVVVARAPLLPPRPEEPAEETAGHRLFTLSARTPEALAELAGLARPVLAAAAGPAGFADVCRTSAAHAGDRHRLALVAATGPAAAEALGAHLGGGRSRVRVREARRRPAVALLFGGQGAQYAGMGGGLYRDEPVFRDVVDTCDRWLREHEGWDVPLPGLLTDPRLNETRYAQPAIYAVECALARVWRSRGVTGAVVLGHSTGEFAAAHVAGVFGLEEGLSLVAGRARLIDAATGGRGATVAVFAGPDEVAAVLRGVGGVSVAARNGPRETLIAGPAGAVAAAVAACAAGGLKHRPVTVPHAPHSPMVDTVVGDLRALASRIDHRPPRIPLISNVTGDVVDRLDADYWCRQLREPVRFDDCVRSLARHGCAAALDLGPAPVLTLLGRQNWTGDRIVWTSSLAENTDDGRQMLTAAAELYTTGVDLDPAIHGAGRRVVTFPGYPFQRERHWFDAAVVAEPVVPAPPAAGRDDEPARFVAEQLADHLETGAELLSGTASFLELGADSLVIARLVQDVNERYGTALTVGRLFDGVETIEALAREIRAHGTARPAPPAPGPDPGLRDVITSQIALMHRQLDMLGGGVDAPVPPRPAPRSSAAPRTEPPAPAELTDRQRAHLDELLRAFTARTAASLDRARTHRGVRVDTRMRSVRPETRPACYPIVAASASGAHLTDLDGNEYVDLAMGFGALLGGHDPAFVTAAVAGQAARGVSVGPVVDGADEAARLLCEMTGKERAFFTVSGTDAVRGALRVASAATGRARFVMFAGSYHGQDDRVLALPDVGGDPLTSVPMAPGISPSAAADALVLPYDSDRSLAIIAEHADELAGVLVEPVQSRNPAVRPGRFLRELRAITARTGVPLIFDEVITGFRVRPGGAQEWFGVEADIAAYGKCLGGGYPVGAVAGAARYLDVVDGGAWADGPGTAVPATTYIGSTFENHPATVAASVAMLRHLRDRGPALQARLNAETDHLATTLNAVFARAGAPIRVVHFGSVFRFTWKGNASYAHQPLAIEVFHFHLLLRGIYLWEGRTCFLSTAHTRSDVDAVVTAAEAAVAAMRDGGFLPEPDLPAVTPAQAALLARPADAPDWTVAEDVELTGPLDVDRLRAAVGAVVSRHESLRTVFPDGSPARGGAPGLEVVDEPPWAEPFDLAAGPLTRFLLVRRAPDRHDLVLFAHHVVSDGISMTVLLDELSAAYDGTGPGEPAAPFTDHLAHLARRDVPARLPYWRHRLAGWPGHRGHPGAGDAGERHVRVLDAGLTALVRGAARELGSTVFQVLLTAHGLLVHHDTGSDDVVFGVPVAGRDHPRGDSVVGYCAEMVPVRSVLDRDGTVRDYHRSLRRAVLDGIDHQLPLADIRHLLGSDGTLFPLHTVVNLDRAVPAPAFGGLSTRFRPVPSRTATVDLRLDLIESGDTIGLTVDYRTDVHDAAFVTGWADRYTAVLRAVAFGPATPVGDISPVEEAAS